MDLIDEVRASNRRDYIDDMVRMLNIGVSPDALKQAMSVAVYEATPRIIHLLLDHGARPTQQEARYIYEFWHSNPRWEAMATRVYNLMNAHIHQSEESENDPFDYSDSFDESDSFDDSEDMD